MTRCETAGRFARAMAGGDIESAAELLQPDVVFLSPIVHQPYQGREVVVAILRAVVAVFEDFGYGSAYSSDDGHVLAFSANVGGRDLQGVDILRLGDDGLIAELTVMVRPLSAATALRERMAALLAG